MSHRDKPRSYSSSDSSGKSADFFRDEHKEALRIAESEVRIAESEVRLAKEEERRVKEEERRVKEEERRVKIEIERVEDIKRQVEQRKRRAKDMLRDAKRKRGEGECDEEIDEALLTQIFQIRLQIPREVNGDFYRGLFSTKK